MKILAFDFEKAIQNILQNSATKVGSNNITESVLFLYHALIFFMSNFKHHFKNVFQMRNGFVFYRMRYLLHCIGIQL